MQRALSHRPDLRAASAQLEAARRQAGAIRAERLPTVSGFVDKGAIGKDLSHMLNTYDFGLQLSLPIFDGFRRESRLQEQQAVAGELDVRRRDLEAQASVEVRGALLDVRSAREQVAATAERVRLAEQELSQARERFRAGVAGNADVITAVALAERRAHRLGGRADRLPDRPRLARTRPGRPHRAALTRRTTVPNTNEPTDRPMSATAAPETSRPAAAPPRAAAEPAPARSKRRIVLPIVGLLALLGAGWGAKQWSYARAHESTDNAQVDGHIVPVIAKVGGYVKTVAVVENGQTSEGQLVVQLDDAEYRVRLAQADAEFAAAQATARGGGADVGQARAQVQTASSQTAAGEAQVAAARANLDRAENDLRRYEDLASKQIVSQQMLDAARSTAAAARATLLSVQRTAAATGAGVTGAQAGVQSAEAGVRLAEARTGGARAARENAALQLSYTKITAPATGVVSRKSVEVGQLVQPGQTLMSIVADTGVWVTANVKETQLRDLRVGQKAEIEIDAYEGATIEGTVESIASATGAKFALLPPDNATGNFTKVVQRIPVRIRITKALGADRPLRPGMSVNVHVKTG